MAILTYIAIFDTSVLYTKMTSIQSEVVYYGVLLEISVLFLTLIFWNCLRVPRTQLSQLVIHSGVVSSPIQTETGSCWHTKISSGKKGDPYTYLQLVSIKMFPNKKNILKQKYFQQNILFLAVVPTCPKYAGSYRVIQEYSWTNIFWSSQLFAKLLKQEYPWTKIFWSSKLLAKLSPPAVLLSATSLLSAGAACDTNKKNTSRICNICHTNNTRTHNWMRQRDLALGAFFRKRKLLITSLNKYGMFLPQNTCFINTI